MKAKTFEYNGYMCEPVGNILGGFKVISNWVNYKQVLKIDNYKYEDFYKIARKNKSACDVFKINEKLYIPCSGGLFEIYKNAPIKTLEKYLKWYH